MLLWLALNLKSQAKRWPLQPINYLELQMCDTVPGRRRCLEHRGTVFMSQSINAIIVGLGTSYRTLIMALSALLPCCAFYHMKT